MSKERYTGGKCLNRVSASANYVLIVCRGKNRLGFRDWLGWIGWIRWIGWVRLIRWIGWIGWRGWRWNGWDGMIIPGFSKT